MHIYIHINNIVQTKNVVLIYVCSNIHIYFLCIYTFVCRQQQLIKNEFMS